MRWELVGTVRVRTDMVVRIEWDLMAGSGHSSLEVLGLGGNVLE